MSGSEDFAEEDRAEMDLALYVEHLNIVDAVFDRFGFHEADYTAAISEFDLLNDDDFRAKF